MRKIILLFVIMICNCIYSQIPRLHFNYDSAGNQTKRYLNLESFTARTAVNTKIYKESAELDEEDLLKFSKEDTFSYYPNPVKEQLYLTWELINGNKLMSISIFSFAGQHLKTISNLENIKSTTISFADLSAGSYLVYLNYKNGDKESITILKQ